MSVGSVNKETGGRIPAAGNYLDKVGTLASLHTDAKTNAVSAINEVADAVFAIDDGQSIDSFADVETALATKQNATDNSLDTDAKTIVGAINEHEGDISSLKSGLTNLDNEVNGDATTYPYADVITIEDAVPANLADCSVKIEPVQDLHGYDKPWVGGAGKALFPIKEITQSTGGVDVTTIKDDAGNILGYNLNGTATENIDIWLKNADIMTESLPAGVSRYFYTGLTSEIEKFQFVVSPGYFAVKTTKVDASEVQNMYINITSGCVLNNVKVYPMICLNSETDKSFAPYTNICPISGHTEVDVQRDGKNLVGFGKNTTDKTAQYRPTANQRLGYDILGDNKIKCKALYANSVWCMGWIEVLVPPYADLSKFRVSATVSEKSSGISSYTPGYEIDFAKSSVGHIMLKIWMNNSEVTAQGEYFILDNVQLEYGETVTEFVPYAGKTYTIALGDTIYGGTVDFDSGVMTVTHQIVDMGTLTWNFDSSVEHSLYYATLTGLKKASTVKSDSFKSGSYSDVYYHLVDNTIASHSQYGGQLRVYSTYYESLNYDGSAFKAAMDGHYACFELATPTTIQLTPQQIQLLKGTNTITASTGQISVTVNGVSGSIGQVQEQVNELADEVAEIKPLNYSTTEQKTGQKWIDGRDIYFITIDNMTNLVIQSNTWTDTPLAKGNIDLILSVSGVSEGGSVFPLAADKGATYIRVNSWRNDTVAVRYITLFYTKTT